MRGDAGGHRHVQHDQVAHVSRVSCPHVSRVRLWSRPVPCPLQGPHKVAYGRGGARELCGHPPSLMDRCADLISNTAATKYRAVRSCHTDDSVLQLTYQACPDIQGSESKGGCLR